ncbi:MAG: hypothetical protein JJ847_05820, partial [Prochlorococcus marinus CUG1438]|nr:hypothetical protein [Prochlorococcus marinus CUG1438]
MTSVVPNNNYLKNGSSNQRVNNLEKNLGIDFTNIDESKKLWELGFNTFDNSNNLTDLYIDSNNNLFINSEDASNNKKELLIGNLNFGIISNRYIPIAVEVITDPELNTAKNVGEYILLTKVVNEFSSWIEKDELYAFLFDSDGNWYQSLGLPESNKGINDIENLFKFDLNKDGEQGGLDVPIKIDELHELRSLGFNTFDQTESFTNLYRYSKSGDLYFSSTNNKNNLIELNIKNINFGHKEKDFYKGVAIEKISDPSIGEEYLGKYILLMGDSRNRELDGFIFDENGDYLEEITDQLDTKKIYLAEKLFGIDLNDDDVQGRNIQEFDRDAFTTANDIEVFDGASDNKTLLTDQNSGELLSAPSSDISTQTLLTNKDGSSFVSAPYQTAI